MISISTRRILALLTAAGLQQVLANVALPAAHSAQASSFRLESPDACLFLVQQQATRLFLNAGTNASVTIGESGDAKKREVNRNKRLKTQLSKAARANRHRNKQPKGWQGNASVRTNTSGHDDGGDARPAAAGSQLEKSGNRDLAASTNPFGSDVKNFQLVGCVDSTPKGGGDACMSLKWRVPYCSQDAFQHCCQCAGGQRIRCQEGGKHQPGCPRPKVNYVAKLWREEIFVALFVMKLLVCLHFDMTRQVLFFVLSIVANYFYYLSTIFLPTWPFSAKGRQSAAADKSCCNRSLSGDEVADDEAEGVRTSGPPRWVPRSKEPKGRSGASRMSMWLREAPIAGGKLIDKAADRFKNTRPRGGDAAYTAAHSASKASTLSTINETREDSSGSDGPR
jgi:hypothetical protein